MNEATLVQEASRVLAPGYSRLEQRVKRLESGHKDARTLSST